MSSAVDQQYNFDADFLSYISADFFAAGDALVHDVVSASHSEDSFVPFSLEDAMKLPAFDPTIPSESMLAEQTLSALPTSFDELMAAAAAVGVPTTFNLTPESSSFENPCDAALFGLYNNINAPALLNVPSATSDTSTYVESLFPSPKEAEKEVLVDASWNLLFSSFPEPESFSQIIGSEMSGEAQLNGSAVAVAAADPFVSDLTAPSGWNAAAAAASFQSMGTDANVMPANIFDEDAAFPFSATPSSPSPASSKGKGSDTAESLSGWEESISSKPFRFIVDPITLQRKRKQVAPARAPLRITIPVHAQTTPKRKRIVEERGTPRTSGPSTPAAKFTTASSTNTTPSRRMASVLAKTSPPSTLKKKRSAAGMLSEEEMIAQFTSSHSRVSPVQSPIPRPRVLEPSVLKPAKRARV